MGQSPHDNKAWNLLCCIVASIEQALEDLENLEPVTRNYLIENLDRLMNENVVFETKAISQAMNLPKEFVDGIAWVRTGELSGKIVNRWGNAEKPLAKWFNNGTPDHWIEPLTEGGVLAFPATFGRHGSAIFFMGNQEEGKMIYSKGHFVSGLDKTEAMETGIDIGMNRLKTTTLKDVRSGVSKELESIG